MNAHKTAGKTGAVMQILDELLSEGRESEVRSLVAQLLAKNIELEKKIASRSFKSNEGVSSAQLLMQIDSLPWNDEADDKLRYASGIDASRFEELATKEPPKAPPLRRAIPEKLRRVDNPIAVPDEERACPKCGKERKCIGHDVTEVIDLIPAQVIVRRDRREKLACDACEGELVRAPVGDKVVEGGRMGSALVGQLIIDKYWDGLPLHRQKQRYLRMGLEVAVSTLADQVGWATDLLKPLWRAALIEVLSSKVMHLDGTGLPVLDDQSPKGIKLGALWGYVGRGDSDTALYLYASTGKKDGQREGELGPADVLKLRQGYTVADAATMFDRSFRREGIVECGCNMHARRYFVKALDAGDARAALPLAAFKSLYEIEASIRDRDAESRALERDRLRRHSVK
jgi:transposase